MTKEIMIEVGLSNLIILSIFCLMPFAMSTVANIYFLIIESKYINAFQKIVQEPDKAFVIARRMLPGDKKNP